MNEVVVERQQLADTWLAYAHWLLSRGKHQQAMTATDEIHGLIPPGWNHLPNLLVLMARCIASAEADARLETLQKRVLGRNYGDRLLKLLEEASARVARTWGPFFVIPRSIHFAIRSSSVRCSNGWEIRVFRAFRSRIRQNAAAFPGRGILRFCD